MGQPRVLILGHSFICRLRDFVVKNTPDYHLNLNLADSVTVQWHGMGGRTIAKVRQFDLGEVIRFQWDIVFLQIGTNDLVQRGMSPLTVGSAMEDFVRLLHDEYEIIFTSRYALVVKRGVTLNVATNKTVAKFIQQHGYYVSS